MSDESEQIFNSTLIPHCASVHFTSLSMSPHSATSLHRSIAAGSNRGSVQIFNDGAVTELNVGEGLIVTSLAWRMTGGILGYDMHNPSRPIFTGGGSSFPRPVNCLCVSADQKFLIAGVGDSLKGGGVKVYDLTSAEGGKEIRDLEQELPVECVCTSPNSAKIITGGVERVLYVYELGTFKKHKLNQDKHFGTVRSIEFASNGLTLFSCSDDYTIKAWSTLSFHTDSWRVTMNFVGDSPVLAMSVARCGSYLCSGSQDGKIKVWSTHSGAVVREITGHQGPISGLEFLQEDTDYSVRKIISTSGDGTVQLWNLAAKGRDELTLRGHKMGVECVAVSKDSDVLATTGGYDKTIGVWGAKNGKLRTTLRGHEKRVVSLAISNDGMLLLSGSWDKTVRIWSLESDPAAEVAKVDVGDRIYSVAFSPDERSFFVGEESGRLRQFYLDTGEQAQEFSDGHSDIVHAIATTNIDQDDDKVVSACEDGNVIVWDVDDGEKICTLVGHSEPVQDVGVSPDDEKVVSASADKTVKVWSITDGELLHTFDTNHTGAVATVAIDPSGNFVAFGAEESTWKLVSLVSKKVIYTAYDAHKMPVLALTFSPHGSYLISGSEDKSIKIDYVTPYTYQLPLFVHGHLFRRDCEKKIHAVGDFGWETSETMSTLELCPKSLIEPRFDDKSEQNLVHIAADGGHGEFLSKVLINPEDRKLQELAFFSAMATDKFGRSPLLLAVGAESELVVHAIFNCFELLLSQDFALPFHEKQTSLEHHPSENFPLSEFCEALEKFPTLGLNFVSNISLVTSGDHLVQKGVVRHNVNEMASGCIVVGSESRVPHGIWSQRLHPEEVGESARNRTRSDPAMSTSSAIELTDRSLQDLVHGVEEVFEDSSESAFQEGVPVAAKFVPIKGIAAANSNFLTSVVKATLKSGNFEAFNSKVVRIIVQHKWKTYVRRMFICNLLLDLMMVFSLTVDIMVHSNHFTLEAPYSHIPTALTLVLWLFFAKDEVLQFLRSATLSQYLGFWNFLDFTSLTSIAVAYIFRWNLQQEYATAAYAIALPLNYLNTLYYMQGFEESGQLIRMILGIIEGIRLFLVILFVCVVGFALAFYVLYDAGSGTNFAGEDLKPYGMENPFSSLFAGFLLLLGDFDVTEFEASSSYYVTLVLFVVFMIFINIVMLNLLIAIMGDIFDRIRENARAEFTFARAIIILEFEEMLASRHYKDHKYFPTWLQVLVPTVEGGADGDNNWIGTVGVLKGSIESFKAQMASEMLDLKNKLAESERKREQGDVVQRKMFSMMESLLKQVDGNGNLENLGRRMNSGVSWDPSSNDERIERGRGKSLGKSFSQGMSGREHPAAHENFVKS
ncbi:hypothetical protein TrST_g10532 [Triparma strigata]|uniref:Ion transport domain-containing protein n=1 Tax=Triparma strigata TaxID=1606541 RepID=A0A9W6ZLF5_9STRA|nr:hypothetical protein TrST_g10532 [Triparma strigata]